MREHISREFIYPHVFLRMNELSLFQKIQNQRWDSTSIKLIYALRLKEDISVSKSFQSDRQESGKRLESGKNSILHENSAIRDDSLSNNHFGLRAICEEENNLNEPYLFVGRLYSTNLSNIFRLSHPSKRNVITAHCVEHLRYDCTSQPQFSNLIL